MGRALQGSALTGKLQDATQPNLPHLPTHRFTQCTPMDGAALNHLALGTAQAVSHHLRRPRAAVDRNDNGLKRKIASFANTCARLARENGRRSQPIYQAVLASNAARGGTITSTQTSARHHGPLRRIA